MHTSFFGYTADYGRRLQRRHVGPTVPRIEVYSKANTQDAQAPIDRLEARLLASHGIARLSRLRVSANMYTALAVDAEGKRFVVKIPIGCSDPASQLRVLLRMQYLCGTFPRHAALLDIPLELWNWKRLRV